MDANLNLQGRPTMRHIGLEYGRRLESILVIIKILMNQLFIYLFVSNEKV